MTAVSVPFVALAQLAQIVAAYLEKGWIQAEESTAGTVTQTVVKFPLGELAGFMVCLQFIFIENTDADHGETVTFAEEFVSIYGVASLKEPSGFDCQPVNQTTTGFEYDNGGGSNNANCKHVAMGAVLVAL